MSAPEARAVFLNVPFDSQYEPLFVTLVGVLVFLGQEPHSVLEVREKGDGRLMRIVELVRACRMSIHDLSRTGTPVRFNMPFELGLACTFKVTNPGAYEIFVMDSQPYRLDKSLSDYKGRDPLIHNNTCDGILACLLDMFVSDVPDATREFRSAARVLRRSARLMKQDIKAGTLFRPALFRKVIAAATSIAAERGFIRP